MKTRARDSMRPSESHPADAWLRASLAPERGCCERLVAEALASQAEGREVGARRWRRMAAAALLALGLGGAMVLLLVRRDAAKISPPGVHAGAGGPVLITNASGRVRLMSVSEAPSVDAGEEGLQGRVEIATLVWNHGTVLAVKELGGSAAVRISGGVQ